MFTWEKFFKTHSGNNYPNEIIVRFVMNYYKNFEFNDRKKIKILDLGCGTGANFLFLYENNFSVSAIDKSKNALKKLMLRCKKKRIIIEKKNIKLATFDKIPFKNEEFDMVIDSTSLQHCKKSLIKKSIFEIRRVMKRNGCFFSIFQKNYQKKGIYYNLMSHIELKKLLKKNFKKILVGSYSFNLPLKNMKENFYLIKSIRK